MRFIYLTIYAFVILLTVAFAGCRKLIEIDAPINTITTEQVFQNNKQAERALAGVYSRMINGSSNQKPEYENFAAGLASFAGALSSDEVNGIILGSPQAIALNTNSIRLVNATFTDKIWESCYKTIYDANGVIEGIQASTSGVLSDSARKHILGEAKAIRAFSYFYLINYFGDVPLLLTIDYSKTRNLPRTAKEEIYALIVSDLLESRSNVPEDFRSGNSERIRITKWAIEALLARVYLYTGQYQNAINSATAVIDRSDLFGIEPDLNAVFLKNSQEAIWQLQQAPFSMEKAVPDARMFMPTGFSYMPNYPIDYHLIQSFEPSDKRLNNWFKATDDNVPDTVYYYLYKYKIVEDYGMPEEYSMVLRLAEMYLIRAEASILLSSNNKTDAIADINVIRHRADVDELPETLTTDEVISAIAKERRMEFVGEWSHRWFDLKRTGKASAVLSAVSYKKPWNGDYQLLYPIPKAETDKSRALIQNPEYNNR